MLISDIPHFESLGSDFIAELIWRGIGFGVRGSLGLRDWRCCRLSVREQQSPKLLHALTLTKQLLPLPNHWWRCSLLLRKQQSSKLTTLLPATAIYEAAILKAAACSTKDQQQQHQQQQ